MIPRVMQPHAEKVGDRYRFVGPCIDPRREDPADWTPPPGDGPLALLAFGTSYTDRIDVYRNTIEALDGNGWRLVIATGRVEGRGARYRPAVGPAPLDGPAACGVTGRGRVRHPRRDGLLHRGTVVRRPHGGHSTGRRPTAQRSPTRGAGGRPPPHRRPARPPRNRRRDSLRRNRSGCAHPHRRDSRRACTTSAGPVTRPTRSKTW